MQLLKINEERSYSCCEVMQPAGHYRVDCAVSPKGKALSQPVTLQVFKCHSCYRKLLTVQDLKVLEVGGVQNPTVGWARAHGIRATKLQGPGNRSMPDYEFWLKGGRPKIIEFKRPGELPTLLQEDTIAKFITDGYMIEIHDDKYSAIASLQRSIDAR
jgi:hypothetical protein